MNRRPLCWHASVSFRGPPVHHSAAIQPFGTMLSELLTVDSHSVRVWGLGSTEPRIQWAPWVLIW
jgi:hypothetical protein